MVTNFDKETSPLNKLEEKAAAIIADNLIKHHVGVEHVVSADKIGLGMAQQYECFRTIDKYGNTKPYLTGSRIRKIINRLRVDDRVPCLVATNNGYYVSNNPSEIRDYIRSLKERTAAMEAVTSALTRQFKTAFRGHFMAEIEIAI